jgi:prepilin-type N-terminal cleavage/methylation domain-containing protein
MKNEMKKVMKKSGFTLVEIMIVVAIIGLLAAIGIPSFTKARENSQEKSCLNNLRILDAAKEQDALQNGLKVGDASGAYADYVKGALPLCPIGKTVYTANIGVIGTDPTCPNFVAASHNAILN